MKANHVLTLSRKGADKDGKTLVQVRSYFGQKTYKHTSTGIRIPENDWDGHNVIVNSKDNMKIRRYLTKLLADIDAYEFDLIDKGKRLTPELLDAFLARGQSDTGDFLTYMKAQMDKDARLNDHTRMQHGIVYNRLRAHFGQVPFDGVNLEFVRAFDNYLRGVDTIKAQNTIARHHRVLRKYINLAVEADLVDRLPYRKFKIKTVQTKHEYLRRDEIDAVAALDLAGRFDLARDRFLFGCFTGLRISDINAITFSNIHNTPGGMELRLDRMHKVDAPVNIPLWKLFSGRAQRIVEKYMEGIKLHPDLPIFPSLSEAKTREYLKTVFYQAGITRHVKFHASRATFGVHVYSLTKDRLLTMALMGIAEQKTMDVYVRMSNELIANGLDAVKWD